MDFNLQNSVHTLTNIGKKDLMWVLDRFMEAFSAIIWGGMTLLIFIQVIARYCLHTPLAWSEEGARCLFIWMTFIAGYVGARKKQHIGVELIQDLFPAGTKRVMQFLSNMLAAGFCILVLYYCCQQWGKLSSQTSPALGFQMSIVYLGMMIGCLGMTVCYVVDALSALRGGHK